MKLVVDEKKLSENPEQIMRRAGYGFIIDRHSGSESFVRHPGQNRYPRFHMYIERQGEKVVFNLHLDQKEARYPGAHAHNAEYDGTAVENELRRIKSFIAQDSEVSKINEVKKENKKEGWLKKLFK